MFCTKCGKEITIADGDEKVCQECKKNVAEPIISEEKESKKEKIKKDKENKEKLKKDKKNADNGEWKVTEKKEKVGVKGVLKGILIPVITFALIAIVIWLLCFSTNRNNIGNTIGNIRNYGYAAENNNWIYYLAPNEDSTEIGIFKIRNNGNNKQQLYMSELDIVSINVYKGYVYFIASSSETYLEEDQLDNKIYRMKTDGTELEIINDNELNNDCYEIYVINNNVYYIGLNAEICKMDLNGANKTVLADNGTGYLGITDKYIIYNSIKDENSAEYITNIMNLDGTNARAIIKDKRLYSVNIVGKYIYYTDSNKKLYRTKIDSNVEELLYENIETYNLNTDNEYAYYLNYLDSEKQDYTVCLFRVKLDGTSKAPEKIKEFSTYSSFIDVVGDWVIYMDSSEDAGFINLVNKTGNKEEVELYCLDYNSYYENLEESGVIEEIENATETVDNNNQTVENATNTANNEVTNNGNEVSTNTKVENNVSEETINNTTAEQ